MSQVGGSMGADFTLQLDALWAAAGFEPILIKSHPQLHVQLIASATLAPVLSTTILSSTAESRRIRLLKAQPGQIAAERTR